MIIINSDSACEKICKEIGEYLKNRRIELGMSAIELSHKSGICKSTIYKYESGSTSMSIYLLSKICYALGIELSIELTPIEKDSSE